MYYFKQVEYGEIVSVESKSVEIASPNFFKATKTEYDDFIASLPIVEPPSKLVRDLLAELDDVKMRLDKAGL